MICTKRQLVARALEKLGLSSYIFDMQSEDLQSCLNSLDEMMESWESKVQTGYPIPSDESESSLDEKCVLIAGSNRAIVDGLCLSIAPMFGKDPGNDLRISAKRSFDNLLMKSVMPRKLSKSNYLPKGSGNIGSQTFGLKYFNESDPPISAHGDFLEN